MRALIYNRLKELGFNPKTIIDCGACVGEWSGEIRTVYNDSLIMGVDANDWSNGVIQHTHITEIQVLSNEDDKETIFYKKVEGLCTGDSIFKENTQHYQEHNTIEEIRYSKTLKTLCEKHNIDKVDLLKIDTQGSEIKIMEGLGDKLNEVEFIELECSLVEWNIGGCLFNDVINYLNENFNIFDIIELKRFNTTDLVQIDVIFQNKKSKIIKPIW